MTALPIDPTDEQLEAIFLAASTTSIISAMRGGFQAGVEAERARAAAETTEEWDEKQRARFPRDCPTCGAKVGAPCYSTPGHMPHAARVQS